MFPWVIVLSLHQLINNAIVNSCNMYCRTLLKSYSTIVTSTVKSHYRQMPHFIEIVL